VDAAPADSPAVDAPRRQFDIAGKSVLITGASSGIGEHLAGMMWQHGARVLAVARRESRLDDLRGRCPGLLARACDVTADSSCADAVATAIAEFGALDVLINCAGMSKPAPALEETADDFRSVLAVNLVAPFVLSQAAGRHMLARGSGSIINIASILGLVGLGRMPQASYAASKAGVVNLTRELAAQWARKGVRVNAVAPGWFATEMTAGLFSTPAGEAWVGRLTPMGRAGNADELDGVVLFLASDASSYVTGAVIPVDGGWTAV
jgi:NAD(P)-dependent dehydrogenase (short-subunit alcohol dehydrogenase family)